MARPSTQTAKVISHTEAFNYVWLNGSCLASRMTSRLNNRTIRALSGADGNTTWYLLNALLSRRTHTHTHTCVCTLPQHGHAGIKKHRCAAGFHCRFIQVRLVFIFDITVRLLDNAAPLVLWIYHWGGSLRSKGWRDLINNKSFSSSKKRTATQKERGFWQRISIFWIG